MLNYIAKRLLLLPITLFFIALTNFVIINLAPGEPVMNMQSVTQSFALQEKFANSQGQDEQYLQFREFFGLTLPILFNTWPHTSEKTLLNELQMLKTGKYLNSQKELNPSDRTSLRILFGDRASFCLEKILSIAKSKEYSFEIRKLAYLFFLRGARKFGTVGPSLSEEQKLENRLITRNNLFLDKLSTTPLTNEKELNDALHTLTTWFSENKSQYIINPSTVELIKIFFFQTRFARYFFRVAKLDFGVVRNDPNRRVIDEVFSRLKYSLTLTVIPLVVTLILCQLFGISLAIWNRSLYDYSLSALFLILWAIPVFVVAPFLIEKIALHKNFPFTDIPFPIRGFSSDSEIFSQLSSQERLFDILRHITLPLIAIFYASFAVETRFSKAIFSDVLRQDYIKFSRAKGCSRINLYFKHATKSAAIPIVTQVASSFGLLLGGAIIVETVFDIHGFGKFFYDAILNRDYNVMMFSAIMSAFLALLGYLAADISYMILDPRVTFEKNI